MAYWKRSNQAENWYDDEIWYEDYENGARVWHPSPDKYEQDSLLEQLKSNSKRSSKAAQWAASSSMYKKWAAHITFRRGEGVVVISSKFLK